MDDREGAGDDREGAGDPAVQPTMAVDLHKQAAEGPVLAACARGGRVAYAAAAPGRGGALAFVASAASAAASPAGAGGLGLVAKLRLRGPPGAEGGRVGALAMDGAGATVFGAVGRLLATWAVPGGAVGAGADGAVDPASVVRLSEEPERLAANAAGTLVACTTGRGDIEVVGVRERAAAFVFKGHAGRVVDVGFGAGMLASIGEDGTFCVWDVREGGLYHQSEVLRGGALTSVQWDGTDPRRAQCAVGNAAGVVRFFDASHPLCPLVQVVNTNLVVREALSTVSGSHGPSEQQAVLSLHFARQDRRAEEEDRGEDGAEGPDEDGGGEDGDGSAAVRSLVFCCTPQTMVVLDGESYAVMRSCIFAGEGEEPFEDGRLTVLPTGMPHAFALASRAGQGDGLEVLCYATNAFLPSLCAVRCAYRFPPRARAEISIFPSRAAEAGESALHRAFHRVKLQAEKKKPPPPAARHRYGPKPKGVVDLPVTFRTKVKSSGYGVTHPKRQLGRPMLKPKPMRRPAQKVVSPMHHRYPMDCGPLTRLQTKNRSENVHAGPVLRLEYSPDGTRLLTCGADRTACALKLPVAKYGGDGTSFLGHDGPVTGGCWGRAGTTVLTGSADRTVCLWSVAKPDPILRITHTLRSRRAEGKGQPRDAANGKIPAEVRAVAFTNLDDIIAVAYANQVNLFKYAPGGANPKDDISHRRAEYRSLLRLASPAQAVTDVACANGFISHLLVCGTSARSIEIYDIDAGRRLASITNAHGRGVGRVTLNAGSTFAETLPEAYNLFASTATDGFIRLWDLRLPSCVRCFEGHLNKQVALRASFSPCMRYVSSGSEDKSACTWDLRTGQLLGRVGDGVRDVVTDVAYNPVHPQMALATADGVVQFYAEG